MEQKHRDFIYNMDEQCSTHDDWLVFVRFGMPTLIKDQDVLVELIYREAMREAQRSGQDEFRPAEFMKAILDELGLHLENA